MMKSLIFGILSLLMFASSALSEEFDIRALVLSNLELSRGTTSYAEMTMFIKRPNWERKSSLTGWIMQGRYWSRVKGLV